MLQNSKRPLRQSSVPTARSSSALIVTLICSLFFHVVVFLLPWRLLRSPTESVPPAPLPQLTMVELTSVEPPSSAPSLSPHSQELQQLQRFHDTAMERTAALEQSLVDVARQQVAAENARQQQERDQAQQATALAAARTDLSQQVQTLTTAQADLSAQLAEERQRAAALERELQATLHERAQEVAGVKGTYDRLVAALQGEIEQKDIALHQAKERLVVSILDRVLFPSGQATLSPEGQAILKKVGAVLAKVHDQRLLIEGHTDNVPIGPVLAMRFPSNWELSTARATEVVKYLIAQTGVPAERLSAVGRADTAPVAGNTDEDGRKQNRRIEIILLPPDGPTSGMSQQDERQKGFPSPLMGEG